MLQLGTHLRPIMLHDTQLPSPSKRNGSSRFGGLGGGGGGGGGCFFQSGKATWKETLSVHTGFPH